MPPLPSPTSADTPPAQTATRRIEQPSTTAPSTCTLILMNDPTIRFTVRSGQCVGRTEASDVVLRNVPDVDAISSRHALFTERKGQWYVQHAGRTNFVQVDGSLYRGDEEAAIYEGSVVVLSLTAFLVRLEGASS